LSFSLIYKVTLLYPPELFPPFLYATAGWGLRRELVSDQQQRAAYPSSPPAVGLDHEATPLHLLRAAHAPDRERRVRERERVRVRE
jgi:hypothetical protein